MTILVVLALVAGIALLAGCGDEEGSGDSSPSAGSLPKSMAVITPEKGNDYGWNQQGVTAAEAVGETIGATVEVQDGAGYGDITQILNQLVDEGSELLIAWASGYNTVTPNVSQRTEVPSIIIGAPDSSNELGLVQNIQTHAEDGAYLIGVLAAKTTATGTVAIVASADDENWAKMSGGFIAGVRATDPAIKILYVQIGQAGYADAAGGKRVTQNAIASGADIIFGFGDGSSFGMMQACETATPPEGAEKVWFIDVIGDKSGTDTKGIYLSSLVWDYEPVLTDAVNGIADGTFGKETMYLETQNDGLKVLKTEWISDEAWAAVEEAKAGVVDGTIDVPLTSTKADVMKYLNE